MILKLNSDLIDFLDSIKGDKSRPSLIVAILQDYKNEYTTGRNSASTLMNRDNNNENVTIRNSRTSSKDTK